MPQVMAHVKETRELVGGEMPRDLGVGGEPRRGRRRRRARGAAPSDRPRRARRPRRTSASSTCSEKIAPPSRARFCRHHLGPHLEALHHAGEARQHEVERDGRVGRDHALDRRVADVALVPERHVLERAPRVAAQQPRETADVLGQDRVALVRHRRRALLARCRTAPPPPHLGALQVADLQRDALAGPGHDREPREEVRVAVARHDLRRDRLGREPEPPADARPRPPARCWRTCRPRPRACRPRRSSRAAASAPAVATQLGVPARALEPEGDGLGVDAVRAADHRRVPVALGLRADGARGGGRGSRAARRRRRAAAARTPCRRRRSR